MEAIFPREESSLASSFRESVRLEIIDNIPTSDRVIHQ